MKTFKTSFVISVIVLFTISSETFSQLNVYNDGSVRINATTGNWGRAIYTKVYYPQSCAYHLQYGGRDRFYVCAEGWLWTERGGYFGSDMKLKKNINKIESPLYKVKKLNGIQFDYKELSDSISNESLTKEYKGQRLGLVAQEVEQVVPGIVKTMPDSTKAIAYTDLTALLIEAMKEQQAQIETLQGLVYSQEQDIIKLKKTIKNCCSYEKEKSNLKSSSINSNESKIENVGTEPQAELFENNPNPFTVDTEIKYFIPTTANKSMIIIHDLQGVQISSHAIQESGSGNITINGSELKAGMYVYTLVVDNKIIDSKRMILTAE